MRHIELSHFRQGGLVTETSKTLPQLNRKDKHCKQGKTKRNPALYSMLFLILRYWNTMYVSCPIFFSILRIQKTFNCISSTITSSTKWGQGGLFSNCSFPFPGFIPEAQLFRLLSFLSSVLGKYVHIYLIRFQNKNINDGIWSNHLQLSVTLYFVPACKWSNM